MAPWTEIVPVPGPRLRGPVPSPGCRRPGAPPRRPRVRCRTRCTPRSRSTASTGSLPGRAGPGRPASPATGSPGGGRPRGGPTAGPRPPSGGGRRCPPGTVPWSAKASVHSDRSKCSVHSWKVPPRRHTCSMTGPIRRSPRLTMPSAAVALGSCHRMVRPRTGRAASLSRWTLRVSSSMVFCPNHWNGVWTLGTNPPTEAVTVTPLWYRWPMATHCWPEPTMPRMSSSRLGGQADQEVQLDPPPALAERGLHGGVEVLLQDQLVDHLAHPPGARPRGRRSARSGGPAGSGPPVPTVKASTRRLGRLTDTWPEHEGSSMMEVTVSSMPE